MALSDIKLDTGTPDGLDERDMSNEEKIKLFKLQRDKGDRKQLNSFLKALVDKRNSGGGVGSALAKRDEKPKQDPVKDELKKISIVASKIVTIKFNNSRLESKLNKAKQKKSGVSPIKKALGGVGKVVGAAAKFPVNVLGALGDLIGFAILNWMGDPKNREAVKRLVQIFKGIIKFLSWFVVGTINNLFGGFAQIIGGRSWIAKLVGVFNAFAGIVGLKWLMAPWTIVQDIIWGFNRLKKWPSILKQLFKGGSRKSIDAIFQKHNSLFRTSLTRTFKRVFLRIFGKGATKILKAFVKPVISKVSGIPLIGPILAFAVNWGVFKEPPGRAAFKAAGSGIGMFLAGAVGSMIPFFGTWVGAALGGLVGDWLGGGIYDLFFGGGDGKPGIVAGLTNSAGSLIDWAWKLIKGGVKAIGDAVVNAGKAVVGGVKKAAGWVGNTAKGAWNWVTSPFGGKKKSETNTETNTETNIQPLTSDAAVVSNSSIVSDMSKTYTMDKKINERRKNTKATFVNLNKKEVTSIKLSVPGDNLNNSGIADNRILERI